jgi:hypothetical protein
MMAYMKSSSQIFDLTIINSIKKAFLYKTAESNSELFSPLMFYCDVDRFYFHFVYQVFNLKYLKRCYHN